MNPTHNEESKMTRQFTRAALAAALLGAASPALAHVGHGAEGLAAGLAHPFTGIDHLLAMVGVGLWAATRGPGRGWQAPLAFMAALAIGALAGLAGFAVPLVETGILASLALLAAMLVLGPRLPDRAGLALVAGFALLHGQAHGAEAVGTPGLFVAGMIAASAVLHAAGYGVGNRLAATRYGVRMAAGGLGLSAMALAGF